MVSQFQYNLRYIQSYTKPEGPLGLHSVNLFVNLSVSQTSFPDLAMISGNRLKAGRIPIYVYGWLLVVLVHLSRRRCPSSVRPPSLTFHSFDFPSEMDKRNSTKLYRKLDLNVIYQVGVFRADRKNKMATLASDWLRHFRLLLWSGWMELNETWQEARSQPISHTSAATFHSAFTSVIGWRTVICSTQSRKTRWPLWSLIGWDIFDFPSETAERNSTKLDRKQNLVVCYKICVFGADRKNKMGALASIWLRHFRLLLWNHRTEFNKTWQEARSQCPLPCLCYSGWSENKMAARASD